MTRRVGFSSLMDGMELPKGDLHFEVLGALDECSAAIAMARSTIKDAETNEALRTIQVDLSKLMGLIAGVASSDINFSNKLGWIERTIAEIKNRVTIPQGFIVPGENACEASLDFSRTVARRAERTLARYAECGSAVDLDAMQYLNRVSTLLYYFELNANSSGG